MPRRPKSLPLFRGEKFIEVQFRPYALEIGRLILAWNALHERLGFLFCQLLGHRQNQRLIAAWQSSTLDRAKRTMLRAVVNAVDWSKQPQPNVGPDVLWVLDHCDRLEDLRNDVAHSPFRLETPFNPFRETFSAAFGGGTTGVLPDTTRKNLRALKIVQKQILAEMKWCRLCSVILRDYSAQIVNALHAVRAPWPHRPSLPVRPEKKIYR